jgi:amino acid transporter
MSETTLDHDNYAVLEAGYKPQLLRRLGFWSSFAISFSFMSVLTGVFANYGFVLGVAGPFGYWSWILVATGQTLVALVFAEMAGRIPLTGCSYNWNSRLTSPLVGWFAGWMALSAYAVGVAAVTVTMFPVMSSLFGVTFNIELIRYIGLGLLLLQVLINIYGVKVAAYLNLAAVGTEIIAICVFGLLLAAVWLSHGHPNVHLLTTIPSTPRPYLPGFLMASLLAAWTVVGFEGAADVTEETVDARRVAPMGILRATLTSSVLGFAFVILLTLLIPNVASLSGVADPVTAIISAALGTILAKAFLILVLISVFACSLVNMTGASRVLFAMSRDNRFIGSSWLNKVSGNKVPAYAVWFVTLIAAIALYFSNTATALYGAGTVFLALFYVATVIGYGVSNLPATDSFSLGRFRWPVILLSIAWLLLEIGIFTIPTQFHASALATGYVLVVGVVIYIFFGRNNVAA